MYIFNICLFHFIQFQPIEHLAVLFLLAILQSKSMHIMNNMQGVCIKELWYPIIKISVLRSVVIDYFYQTQYGCRWMYLHGLEEIATILLVQERDFKSSFVVPFTLQTSNTCRSFIKKRKESMKRNVGKAINIINACSFHPYTGKKALRVKRSNRLY